MKNLGYCKLLYSSEEFGLGNAWVGEGKTEDEEIDEVLEWAEIRQSELLAGESDEFYDEFDNDYGMLVGIQIGEKIIYFE